MLIKHLCVGFFCVMFFFSCNQTSETTSEVKPTEASASQKISKNDIEALNYTDFGLSIDAKRAVENWQKYQELTQQIELLKQADFSFYQTEITLITTFFNDLRAEIPKPLATKEINARLTVLDTKMQKLNSLLLLNNISKSNKLEGIQELLVAFSNLNLQINKKLEFEANDIFKPN